MKIVRYVFAFYLCTALPLSALSQVHYDHSINEAHAPHICFGENTNCDCATEKHAEESLWEHVFEAGCIKDVVVHALDAISFHHIFYADLGHKSSSLEYEIIPSHDILISRHSNGSDRSRAPPLFT